MLTIENSFVVVRFFVIIEFTIDGYLCFPPPSQRSPVSAHTRPVTKLPIDSSGVVLLKV